MRLGPTELLLILAICLLLWGPSRLPDVGRSLGRAISDFRRELRGPSATEDPAEKPASPSPPAEK